MAMGCLPIFGWWNGSKADENGMNESAYPPEEFNSPSTLNNDDLRGSGSSGPARQASRSGGAARKSPRAPAAVAAPSTGSPSSGRRRNSAAQVLRNITNPGVEVKNAVFDAPAGSAAGTAGGGGAVGGAGTGRRAGGGGTGGGAGISPPPGSPPRGRLSNGTRESAIVLHDGGNGAMTADLSGGGGAGALLGGGGEDYMGAHYETESFPRENRRNSVLRRLSAAISGKLSPGAGDRPSAPSEPMVLPDMANRAFTPGTEMRISLKPHVHSRFCDRKERVCTAVGRVRQHEILVITGVQEPLMGCSWIRGAAPDGSGETEAIPSAANSLEYQMTADDVDQYICFVSRWLDDDGNEQCQYASHRVGPVEPGPPKMLNLQVGGDLRVGHHAVAEGEYFGGREGPSQFWWLRIRQGVREPITQATPIPDDVREHWGETDPRIYLLTEDDLGCVIKVKCRPIRSDGDKGEVATSKASKPVAFASACMVS